MWGTWNGITERDGEQIRRVGAMLRFLGGRGYLLSQGWVPHAPTADPANLFASHWPLADGSAAWSVVNRNLVARSGPVLKGVKDKSGAKFYDLYNGVEVTPSANGTLSLDIERFGAVLATSKGPDTDPKLKAFLAEMAGYAKVPLASLDPSWDYEYGARVPAARAESPLTTSGMTKVPGGPLRFSVKGIEIEGSGAAGDQDSIAVNPFGVDFQYEWESQPGRFHTQVRLLLLLPRSWCWSAAGAGPSPPAAADPSHAVGERARVLARHHTGDARRLQRLPRQEPFRDLEGQVPLPQGAETLHRL